MKQPTEARRLRKQLVDQLTKRRMIRTEAVANAFLSVPREAFVPEHVQEKGLREIYKDVALPTKMDSRGAPLSSSSQPAIMARMLDELRLTPGTKVLEIGAGSGYNAALMKKLVGRAGSVTTLDIEDDIVERARTGLKRARADANVVLTDGRRGWSDGAPFDRIIATASALDIPTSWRDQLIDGGYLVVPLRISKGVFWPQAVVTFQKRGDVLKSISVTPGGFMALRSAGETSNSLSTVYVGAGKGDRSFSFGSVFGPTLERFSEKALRNIARVLVQDPMIVNVDEKIPRYDFEVFLALNGSQRQLVSISHSSVNSSIGLVAPNGSWLVSMGKGKRFTRFEVRGDPGGKKALSDLIRNWKRQGRPKARDLSVTVHFDMPKRSGMSKRRGESTLTFDYLARA